MPTVATGRPGRPAAASREQALALARTRFMAGQRVDVQAIARELGLARATMHRWFRTRELLLGEVLADFGQERLIALRRRTGGRGARALLASFDAFNRDLARGSGLRALLVAEPDLALRVLTSPDGIVQPRMVATVQQLIQEEIQRGFKPTLDSDLLAYAIVRLAEAFLYRDVSMGVAGETGRLRQLEAALLRED